MHKWMFTTAQNGSVKPTFGPSGSHLIWKDHKTVPATTWTDLQQIRIPEALWWVEWLSIQLLMSSCKNYNSLRVWLLLFSVVFIAHFGMMSHWSTDLSAKYWVHIDPSVAAKRVPTPNEMLGSNRLWWLPSLIPFFFKIKAWGATHGHERLVHSLMNY